MSGGFGGPDVGWLGLLPVYLGVACLLLFIGAVGLILIRGLNRRSLERELRKAHRQAKERGITPEVIDETIDKICYGKRE